MGKVDNPMLQFPLLLVRVPSRVPVRTTCVNMHGTLRAVAAVRTSNNFIQFYTGLSSLIRVKP